MVMHGHTGWQISNMGHYELDGELNDVPKYKSTWNDNLYLYLNPITDSWVISTKTNFTKKMSYIHSVQKGSSLPLGLDWKFWGKKGDWIFEEALTVQSLDMYLEEGPCNVLEISGHAGKQKFTMGNYFLDGALNGHTKFKSKHLYRNKPLFVYRKKDGFWQVSDDIDRYLGYLRSCSSGASLPLGLHWQYLFNGKWATDNQITVSTLYSEKMLEIDSKEPDLEIIYTNTKNKALKVDNKEPELEFSFMKSEEKVPEMKKELLLMKNTDSGSHLKINIITSRDTNRMGDGLGDPLMGKKTFFPEMWKPTKNVFEGLRPFGLSGKEIEMIKDKGKRFELEASFIDLNVSADHASAIYAYTLEENCIYKKLNKACRTESSINKRRLKVYRDYLYHVNEAATSLPNYQGRTYRSIRTRLPEGMYPIGETITWHQLSSSSVKADVTTIFLEKSKNGESVGSVFVLDVKTGKEISMFSKFPDEEEVLLRLNTFFKVAKKIEKDQEKRAIIGKKAAFNVGNMELVDVYHLEQR